MSERFIGKYEILTTLGKGSMGVVYRARDPEIGRIVAIKTLKTMVMGNDAAGDEALQRFRQESRSAGMLQHPNIITIFEAGKTENGSPYIVMEHIDGESLEQTIAEKGAIEPLEVLHYLSQVASAIDYAHSHNVIHRDIKPSNVIVGNLHKPFLVDFGVAKLADTSLTPAGTVVGTPSYMSPEQIRGLALDGRTDIFSLAVVAFEMFTGVRPYPGKEFTTVVTNIMHKEPRSFEELNVQLPAALEKELHRGLAKDRDERFSSALTMIHSFAQVFSVLVDSSGLVGGYRPDLNYGKGTMEVDAQTKKTTVPVSRPKLSATPIPNQSNSVTELKPGSGIRSLYVLGFLGLIACGGFVAFAAMQKSNSEIVGSEYAAEYSEGSVLSDSQALDSDRPPLEREEALEDAKELARDKSEIAAASGASQANQEATGAQGPPIAKGAAELETAQGDTSQVAMGTVDSGLSLAGSGIVREALPQEPAAGFTGQELAILSDELLAELGASPSLQSKSVQELAKEFGKRGPGRFIEPLRSFLGHQDFKVRVEALKSLRSDETLQQPEVVEAIIKALSDSEYLVRGFAVVNLGGASDPRARKALSERLTVEENNVVLELLKKELAKPAQ